MIYMRLVVLLMNDFRPQKSTGTAFVIEGERLLTNAHVVRSATDIRVRLHGSTRRFPAKVICYAPEVDLALLKILGDKEHKDFFAQSDVDADEHNRLLSQG